MSRRRTITIDDLVTQKAIAMYQNGATLKAVAEAVFMSREGLKYRFKVLGIEIDNERECGVTAPAVIEKIRNERRAGKSYTQISRELGVCYDTARKYAKDIELGFSTRGRGKIPPGDPRIKKAIELYRGGLNFEDTAAAVGLSVFTLHRCFKQLGIQARNSGRLKMSPEQIEQMRREYQRGKSCSQIARELGTTPPTVRKYVK